MLQDQCGWKSDLPTILSVCLISLEPDSVLRVMQDQFTPGMLRCKQLRCSEEIGRYPNA